MESSPSTSASFKVERSRIMKKNYDERRAVKDHINRRLRRMPRKLRLDMSRDARWELIRKLRGDKLDEWVRNGKATVRSHHPEYFDETKEVRTLEDGFAAFVKTGLVNGEEWQVSEDNSKASAPSAGTTMGSVVNQECVESGNKDEGEEEEDEQEEDEEDEEDHGDDGEGRPATPVIKKEIQEEVDNDKTSAENESKMFNCNKCGGQTLKDKVAGKNIDSDAVKSNNVIGRAVARAEALALHKRMGLNYMATPAEIPNSEAVLVGRACSWAEAYGYI